MHSCSSMHTQRRKVGKEAKQIEQRRFCFLHSTQPVLPKKAGKCSTPVLSHWDGQDTAAVTLRHSAPRQPGPRAHLRSSAGSRRPARTDSPARRPEGTRRHGKDKAALRTSGAPEPPRPAHARGNGCPLPEAGEPRTGAPKAQNAGILKENRERAATTGRGAAPVGARTHPGGSCSLSFAKLQGQRGDVQHAPESFHRLG